MNKSTGLAVLPDFKMLYSDVNLYITATITLFLYLWADFHTYTNPFLL